MSMEWYRAYHGMPYDPKLQVIAKRAGQPMAYVVAIWVCILDEASRHDPRGVIAIDPESVAVVQGIELEAVEDIMKAFHSKGMIDDNHKLTAWNKRQHTTSTERSKKSRSKKKTDAIDCNTTQRDATQGNKTQRKNTKKGTDTDRDTEEDKDLEKDKEKDKNKKKTREKKKGESEREKQKICGKDSDSILQQMLDIWNAEVQKRLTRSHRAILTPKRKELLTVRWIEDFQQDIKAWRYYCEVISASDFCMGRIKGKGWTIDLTWAIESSDHVAKILEGGFSGGNHPPKPPGCKIPELHDSLDQVLERFAEKYNQSACKSWLSGTEVYEVKSHPDGVQVVITCPNKFIQQWLTEHYLTDLNLWWAEHHYAAKKITGVELTVREA